MLIKKNTEINNIIKNYFNIKNALTSDYVINEKPYTFNSFELTRRHGRIVSREKFSYTWSSKARLNQKMYHLTKYGLPLTNEPISELLEYTMSEIDKANKIKLLKERPYSYFHNKLIENLYSKKSASDRMLKQATLDQKHEIELENIAKRLKDYKSSLKKRNPKNNLYKISSYYSDGKQHIKLGLKKFVSKEPTCDEIAELNRRLSINPLYRHTTVRKLTDSTDRFLFVSTNLAA